MANLGHGAMMFMPPIHVFFTCGIFGHFNIGAHMCIYSASVAWHVIYVQFINAFFLRCVVYINNYIRTYRYITYISCFHVSNALHCITCNIYFAHDYIIELFVTFIEVYVFCTTQTFFFCSACVGSSPDCR